MWNPDRPATCVFCGQPIEPGQPSVGRGESAAHGACADRALGDDAYWDRMAASGMGEGEPGTPETGGARSSTGGGGGRGIGCGALAAALLAAALVGVGRRQG